MPSMNTGGSNTGGTIVERDIIIHVHIFKNAGTTFDDTLSRNFSENFVDHREDQFVRNDADFLNQFLESNANVQAFSSHAIFHYPKSTDTLRLHNVFFLRHPIERIRSVYNFEKKQPEDVSLGAAMAKKFDYVEYVEWRMKADTPPTIRNHQTIFLAGVGHRGTEKDRMLELATAHLEETAMRGVVDRFDESMVVFEDHLAPYFPQIDLSYVRCNVTDHDFHTSVEDKAQRVLDDLPAALAKTAQEENRLDMMLYQRANELLDRRLAAIDNVARKLEEFRQRCQRRAS